MKKIIVICALLLLLISCNLDIYKEIGVLPEYEESPISIGSQFNPSIAPDFVKATDNEYADKIKISWRSVPGAASYEVERREVGGDWILLKNYGISDVLYYFDTISSSSSTSIETGIVYEYRVRARSSEGVYGQYSSVVTGRALAAPTGVEASKGDSSIPGVKISWKKVEGISNYRIYMKPDNYGTFTEIGMITSAHDDSDCNYIFKIDNADTKLAGAELVFAVRSVAASSSNLSDFSESRIGYSYVKGSPLPVTGLTIDKGKNADLSNGITLSWDDMDPEFDYAIYRSAPGKEETKIYKLYPTQKIERKNGKVTFVDNSNPDDFDTSMDFTYSVIAIATREDGVELRGPAVTDIGYFISPPEKVVFEKVIKDPVSGYGFELSFEAPFRFDSIKDKSLWDFKVYGWNSEKLSQEKYLEASEKPKSRMELLSTIKELAGSNVYTISADSIPSDGKYFVDVFFGADKCDAFAITFASKDGSIETYPGKSNFEWKGVALENVSASRNEYFAGLSANSNGVYPVKVSFSYNDYGVDFIDKFDVIVEGSDIVISDVKTEGNTRYVIDDTDHRVPGRFYSYTIRAYDAFGKQSSTVVSGGYGGITPVVFRSFFESTAFKPWERSAYLDPDTFNTWKNSEIGRKIQKGYSSSLTEQMESLGDVTHSSPNGGSVHYNARQEGIGGAILFEYNNFGLTDFMYSTGSYTMNVNASGTGTTSSSTGGISITGLYPGKIGWGSLSVVSKKFSGNYEVTVNYSNGKSITGMVTSVY